ncbi:molybdate ABC transporter substrate-binding protein [Sphingomonas sp. HMP6]|uniref:molybdate ABC transporter substrate-binding protein n=1 Tax=Sphingomonas sp. HMP6 TaxID=1517551 RepID=UPI001596D540|nr:molybdate ABC transporter substrate-binding protein [Sphingomonas sp. HMP6]BCA57252.1 molybdenum ABC transporter substrate-binding protein [Sphingomonas sp. HMP6]
MKRRILTYALVAMAAALATSVPLMAATPAPVTVFAAASLTDALQAVGKSYTARTGVPVRFSFAASNLLAKQIEAGARADLFVSADQLWMDHVARAGFLVAGSRSNLLRGRLVLIAPADSRTRLRIAPNFPLAQALGPTGRLAVGDPAYVPAGLYAKTALTRLGIWPSVEGKLAPADNVRVALSYVARHAAPLGIVYETDARAERGVMIIGIFPESSHPPIDYPAAIVRGAGPAARGFATYLGGAEAKAIFRRFGFRTF